MFKDYYSVLGISYPSTSEEIQKAYNAKKEALGKESSNSSNPNYQERVELELAYRVLGASYILKTAYDGEYEEAKAEDFDSYEVKHESLLSDIEREREFVVNRILSPNFNMPKANATKEKGWGMKVLGCLGKGFFIYLCLTTFVYVKKCSRERMRDSYGNQSTYVFTESAVSKLKHFDAEK